MNKQQQINVLKALTGCFDYTGIKVVEGIPYLREDDEITGELLEGHVYLSCYVHETKYRLHQIEKLGFSSEPAAVVKNSWLRSEKWFFDTGI